MGNNLETAEQNRTRKVTRARLVKLPGRSVEFTDKDPNEIALDLYAKSALARREARLRRVGRNG